TAGPAGEGPGAAASGSFVSEAGGWLAVVADEGGATIDGTTSSLGAGSLAGSLQAEGPSPDGPALPDLAGELPSVPGGGSGGFELSAVAELVDSVAGGLEGGSGDPGALPEPPELEVPELPEFEVPELPDVPATPERPEPGEAPAGGEV